MVALGAGIFVELDNTVESSEDMFAGDQGSGTSATLRRISCISAYPGHPGEEYY